MYKNQKVNQVEDIIYKVKMSRLSESFFDDEIIVEARSKINVDTKKWNENKRNGDEMTADELRLAEDIISSKNVRDARKEGFLIDTISKKRGGKRPNAGRPKTNMEPTKAIRLAESTIELLPKIKDLVELIEDWETRADKPNSPRWNNCTKLIKEIKELIK